MPAGATPKTLLLLRHAKSSWADASLDDHERPLNARGRAAARRMGAHLRKARLRPDLVLCSTAVRTRQTLDFVLEALGSGAEVRALRELYLASAERLADCVAGAPAAIASLLIVAHNPGIGQLAEHLSVSGDAQGREHLRRKFPTAALAHLRCDGSWRECAAGCELVAFVRPKDLEP